MSENGRMDVKNKIWDICGILRDDGMHIGTYVEQVTVLLFLKMMEEKETFGEEPIEIPDECNWETLKQKDGEELLSHYNTTVLPQLGEQDGIIGEIFARVNSQFRTPVNLRRAVREIDEINWSEIDTDVKGAAYESLLEKYAEEAKGAGQYFTPRAAIKAVVEAVDPDNDDKIHDPAAGTGGFLIHAFEHILDKTNEGLDLSREERQALMTENLSGRELVPETRRLGLMNLALHDLQPENFEVGDSLAAGPHTEERYDVILTNPPYGGNQQKEPTRDDFMVETKKPELNFLQHCMTLLNAGGKCGIVVPDGVLFQGGQAERVRENLLRNFDLHTILILPIGAFHPYTNVTTNVVFFENGGTTEDVSFYDLRTSVEKIKKSNPLTKDHFEDFLDNFGLEKDDGRYFEISLEEVERNDYSLNYKKYRDFEDDGDETPPPEELITELLSLQETIKDNSESILAELEEDE
ncbi:type I restriction-modification system subunit M [Halomarina ordinaria]|uniref:site-specific DNA-methyltransferase (adenine-specific) n=1 Tax=Halomarina ordinaria TaxID=3033939 RepID=A0ABD5UA37_9EURY|nr:type I restriction-modification system subunit M [Halomarina sp. PSRA2]